MNMKALLAIFLVIAVTHAAAQVDTNANNAFTLPPKLVHAARLVQQSQTNLQDSSWGCSLCQLGIGLVDNLIKTNSSITVIESACTSLCTSLNIEKADVCQGIVASYASEVVEILTSKYLSPLSFCELVHACNASALQSINTQDHHTYDNMVKLGAAHLMQTNQPTKQQATNVGTFLHLSDLHFDQLYAVGSTNDCGRPLCCHEAYGPGNATTAAGPFGDYQCDTPLSLLEALLSTLASLSPAPDFILWTGDDPSHMVWAQSRELNLASAVNITLLLQKYLPKVPVFPVIGNHEGFAVNQFKGPGDDSWLLDGLAKVWSYWLPAEPLECFRAYGFYSTVVSPGLRVVGLHTSYWQTLNFWLILEDQDPASQIVWLNDTLATAKANNEKVMIIGHIPPGVDDAKVDSFTLVHRILDTYADILVGTFFGHTHDDSIEIMRDFATGTVPRAMAFITPSITPYTNLNPSWRQFTYDRDTFSLLDFTQYRTDLARANLEGKVTWVPAYSAKSAYNLNSLAASEWQSLVTRMSTDDTLFNVYLNNVYTGRPPACDAACKKELLCEAASFRQDILKSCKASVRATTLGAGKPYTNKCSSLNTFMNHHH